MDSIPIQLIIQLVLIFLNAFFAATEIAVLSLNKPKLEEDASKGDKTAIRLLKLTKAPAGFLSTIQVGITLAGFLGSAFAADNFAKPLVNLIYNDWRFTSISLGTLNTLAVILITIILSYFTLVLGELVPKRIAMQKPYEVAKFTSPIVYWLSIIMKPGIWLLSISTNLFLKLFRLKVEAEEDRITEDEIRLMVKLGEKTGTVEKVEGDWIQNVFEFNDKKVVDLMTPLDKTVFIDAKASRKEIEEIIRINNYSRYPVYKKNKTDIIGILNVKDFFIQTDKNLNSILREPYIVSEKTLADDLFHAMQRNKMPLAIIVDDKGVAKGITTTEDLLEEIVGNIVDEYDMV